MSTHWNGQLDNKNKIYSLQFETDSYRKYKEVEKICQAMVDKSNEERTEAYWSVKFDDALGYETYSCSNCGAEYIGLPRSPVCPCCTALIVEEKKYIKYKSQE